MVSVLCVSVLMVIGAVAQIIHAFRVKRWGGFLFWLLSGVLYGVAGVIAFADPLPAALALTLVLAVALLASGVLRVWSGFRLRPEPVGAGPPNTDWALEDGMVAPVYLLYPGSEHERMWLEEVVVVSEGSGRPLFSWGFAPLTAR